MAATRRDQLNVPVRERLAIAARQASQIRGVSVPELLRPVVERFLESLLLDENVRAATDAVERGRQAMRGASVKTLTPQNSDDREPLNKLQSGRSDI